MKQERTILGLDIVKKEINFCKKAEKKRNVL